MMNPLSILTVLGEIDSKVQISAVAKDVMLLYPIYSVGKFDAVAAIKNGTFEPTVAAGARLFNLADALLKDKVDGPEVEKLILSYYGEKT